MSGRGRRYRSGSHLSPWVTSVPLLWKGLLEGRSGIRRITQFDASDALPDRW